MIFFFEKDATDLLKEKRSSENLALQIKSRRIEIWQSELLISF